MGGARRSCFLIGYPVSHSLSPAMFNAAFRALGMDWVYHALAVPAGAPVADLLARLARQGAVGINVTMPLKGEVLTHCRSLSPRAEAVGAANTLSLGREGWEADNTDWPGLGLAITEVVGTGALPRGGRPGLVFGAGGAAAAAAFCLAEMGFPVVIVNRGRGRGQELAKRVAGGYVPWGDAAVPALVEQAAVVVNATPLGMGGEGAGGCALPPGVMPRPDAVACELVYHPPETEFLRRARKAGAKVVDGLSVLLWQAVPALERWTGRSAPVEVMRKALRASVPGGHAGGGTAAAPV